jgi:hypothetical protein
MDPGCRHGSWRHVGRRRAIVGRACRRSAHEIAQGVTSVLSLTFAEQLHWHSQCPVPWGRFPRPLVLALTLSH